MFCRLHPFRRVGWLALLLSLLPLSADADEAGGWKKRVMPLYYWSISISGKETASPGDPPADLGGFDFNFEGAFSLNAEVVKDNRWGALLDVIWVDLGNTREFTKLNFELLETEADIYYRFPDGNYSFDLLGGLRYYDAEARLQPPGAAVRDTWVDPVVGMRWNWQASDHWALSARGDLGGFGIGSDLSWQALATASWQPNDRFAVTGGLRAMDVDYDAGGLPGKFILNIRIWGPLMGFSVRW